MARTLRRLTPSTTYAETGWREPACSKCGAEFYPDPEPPSGAHTCCRCRDTRGRVRIAFGETGPCPCTLSVAPNAALAAARPGSGIPATLAHARIDNWEPATGKPRAAAEAFVESWPPMRHFLVFSGTPGNGKSHLAVGVLQAAWERHNVVGRFYLVGDMFDRLRATQARNRPDGAESLDHVHAVLFGLPLLVLDDLGADRITEWGQGELFKLIDHRHRELKPTIVTTNLARVTGVDDRLISRLADIHNGTLVEMGATPDHRLR